VRQACDDAPQGRFILAFGPDLGERGSVTRHQVSREIATPSFARSFHVVQSSQVG